jgi:large subunit ribosomal protein L1
MDKKQILEAIKQVKESSPKRNFKQTFDLIIVLTGLDMKKPDSQVNSFVNLHHSTGKKVSVCALVGPELKQQAKDVCDESISDEEFVKYKDKRLAKQLAEKHDFFIAQATIMPKIATAFGKVFGPKGKMPNPKAGCVVPPNANLKPLYDRLQKVVKVQTRNNQPLIQCGVGIEGQDENEISDNILDIYNNVTHTLPNGEHKIRDVKVKLTMGSCVTIGAKAGKKEAPKVEEKVKAPKEKKVEVKEEKAESPKEEAKKE